MATKKIVKNAPQSAHNATAKAAGPVEKKAAKKAAAKKTTSKTVRKVASKAVAAPTPDALARAAYLNYRRRVEQGLPGDSHGDWLEAERYFSRTSEA